VIVMIADPLLHSFTCVRSQSIAQSVAAPRCQASRSLFALLNPILLRPHLAPCALHAGMQAAVILQPSAAAPGPSDSPAWIAAEAEEYADAPGGREMIKA
jgi:hypothetical protein